MFQSSHVFTASLSPAEGDMFVSAPVFRCFEIEMYSFFDPQRATLEHYSAAIPSPFRDTLRLLQNRKRYSDIDDIKIHIQSASSSPYRQCAIFSLAGTKAKTLPGSARFPDRRGNNTHFRIQPIRKAASLIRFRKVQCDNLVRQRTFRENENTLPSLLPMRWRSPRIGRFPADNSERGHP